MNYIGHPYDAYKVLGRMNPYIAAGAELPDLIPFITSDIYDFDAAFQLIHEGGEEVMKVNRDLGLAMLTHGITYGADKYNKEIDQWVFGDDKKTKDALAQTIVDCSGISFEGARKWRVHNYMWVGVDMYIMNTYPSFVELLNDTTNQVDAEEIVNILARALKVDAKEITRMTKLFLQKERTNSYSSIENYVKLWKKVLSGLPEKDEVNEEKTMQLFDELYIQNLEIWPIVLDRVITNVKTNIKNFL